MKAKIIQWAKDRKIIPNSSARVQCLKAVSELGELADALIKHDTESVRDAIGDVMVCYYNALELRKDASCYDALDILSIMTGFLGELYLGVISEDLAPEQVLTVIAESQGFTLDECIEHAYNVIKDRKGELLPNGVFVKEEEDAGVFW